ncbi:Hypothetical protein NTJ_01982 [Nesidiocoris tenuis]|uniref:Uncharacterized protein n=1 Tax=Nesidiocoris tenuis TaxID=355587 RepID=A0ABN7AE87_9HEMI|nr:Hypothetical protein NTJ_01982 [Nesidiocoris tenuis]
MKNPLPKAIPLEESSQMEREIQVPIGSSCAAPEAKYEKVESNAMWFWARRTCTVPSVTVFLCLLFSLLFLTKHLKDLYDLTRKAQRFRRYTDFLEEVSETMSNLEVNANKSLQNLQVLNNAIDSRFRADRPPNP